MPKSKRNLKDQVIQTVTDDKTNDKIEIKLDRNKLEFFARYQGDEFRHKEAEPVIAWADEHLKSGRHITWYPVIDVRCNSKVTKQDRWPGVVMIDYAIHRLYIGVTDGRNLKTCDWMVWENYQEQSARWDTMRKGTRPERLGPEPERKTYTRDELMLINAHNCNWKIKLTKSGEPILPFDVSEQEFDHYRAWEKPDRYRLLLTYTDEMWAGLNQMLEALRALGSQLDDLIKSDTGQARIGEVGAKMLGYLLPDGKVQKENT